MGGAKRDITVRLTEEVAAELDRLVEAHRPVRASRSAIAAAAIEAGLPVVAEQMGSAKRKGGGKR